MQEVASILKNMTSTKQYDTEREDNHLLITYEIATSESNKGTMALNDELLSDGRLNINDIDIIETEAKLNLTNKLKPENNSMKSKDSFESAFNVFNNIIVEKLITYIIKKHNEGITINHIQQYIEKR